MAEVLWNSSTQREDLYLQGKCDRRNKNLTKTSGVVIKKRQNTTSITAPSRGPEISQETQKEEKIRLGLGKAGERRGVEIRRPIEGLILPSDGELSLARRDAAMKSVKTPGPPYTHEARFKWVPKKSSGRKGGRRGRLLDRGLVPFGGWPKKGGESNKGARERGKEGLGEAKSKPFMKLVSALRRGDSQGKKHWREEGGRGGFQTTPRDLQKRPKRCRLPRVVAIERALGSFFLKRKEQRRGWECLKACSSAP